MTPESALGLADAPSPELADRCVLAASYALAWKREKHRGALDERLNTMVMRLAEMRAQLAKGTFPSKAQKAAYEKLSATWAQLYRDVATATDNLPEPVPFDQTLKLLEKAAKTSAIALGLLLALWVLAR